MRVVAFDVGERRTGVALSDASATLASPWRTLPGHDVRAAAALVRELRDANDGLAGIVVGLPRRLDGSPTQLTARVVAFAEALRELCGLPVSLEDERLTSVDAEQRLAELERDWRKRKAKLDAASAAIILQDYLDRRSVETAPPDPAEPRA